MAADLTGRVAVIPLAWPPGAELASCLAAAGATVVVVGPARADVGELLSEIEAAGTGRAAFFDMGDGEDDVDAVAQFVAEQFSR